MKFHVLLLTFTVAISQPAHADLVDYALEIAEERWSPDASLRTGLALTVNGGIPGPTLRFREGDFARIRVTNRLKREETSIHWHGLLLPNKQDGVP